MVMCKLCDSYLGDMTFTQMVNNLNEIKESIGPEHAREAVRQMGLNLKSKRPAMQEIKRFLGDSKHGDPFST